MGRSKQVYTFNERYQGKYLTKEDCIALEKLIRLSDDGGFVKDLKYCIYDLPQSDIDLIKATQGTDFIAEKKTGVLEDLQTIGVAYMYYAKRLILGDSVGMGKTVEVCGLMNLLEQVYAKQGEDFKFLYLTEKSLVDSTQNKLIKFTGNYVKDVYGEKKYVKKFVKENGDILQYSVVGSHSLINSVDFQDYFREYRAYYDANPFDVLIIDESEVLANTATQTYKNGKFLSDMFDYVILLNATPFETNLGMYYNQLHFVDDSFLPTKKEFNDTYVIYDYRGPYPKPSGKYRNYEQFKHAVAYRYLARTRKSTGATFTNCSADVIVSDLSSVQKELLTKTSMPTMVYDCPGYFSKDIETNYLTTPKIKDLINLMNNELKNEPSILVYSRYKESQSGIQKALSQLGIESIVMNGDTPVEEKKAIVSKFQMGDIRVLITNVQKGLDFGNCNVCVFYTYDPNPQSMVQFEGRMTRTYNIDGKRVYLLISRGKELKKFKECVADRAQASDLFAGSDFSCVLSILLDGDRLSKIK